MLCLPLFAFNQINLDLDFTDTFQAELLVRLNGTH